MIVITRHKDTVRLLRERGIISDDDEIISHIDDIDKIKGKVVLGTLPIDVAYYCEAIKFIKWNIPEEYRGKEWTYEETCNFFNGIETFKVIKI